MLQWFDITGQVTGKFTYMNDSSNTIAFVQSFYRNVGKLLGIVINLCLVAHALYCNHRRETVIAFVGLGCAQSHLRTNLNG